MTPRHIGLSRSNGAQSLAMSSATQQGALFADRFLSGGRKSARLLLLTVMALFFICTCKVARAQQRVDLVPLLMELSDLRRAIEKLDPQYQQAVEARRKKLQDLRDWVGPRLGLSGELLNASEIPPQFRAKVAASMGKTVQQVFGNLMEVESNVTSVRSIDASKRNELERRIAYLEERLRVSQQNDSRVPTLPNGNVQVQQSSSGANGIESSRRKDEQAASPIQSVIPSSTTTPIPSPTYAASRTSWATTLVDWRSEVKLSRNRVFGANRILYDSGSVYRKKLDELEVQMRVSTPTMFNDTRWPEVLFEEFTKRFGKIPEQFR